MATLSDQPRVEGDTKPSDQENEEPMDGSTSLRNLFVEGVAKIGTHRLVFENCIR
jgi:hypothetical protein